MSELTDELGLLQQAVDDNILNREYHEALIRYARINQLWEDLEEARETYSKFLAPTAGNIMECIADFKACVPMDQYQLLDWCVEPLNVKCALVFMDALVATREWGSIEEFLQYFVSHFRWHLAEGHLVMLKYLNIMDELQTDRRAVEEVASNIVSTPYVSLKDIAPEIAEKYSAQVQKEMLVLSERIGQYENNFGEELEADMEYVEFVRKLEIENLTKTTFHRVALRHASSVKAWRDCIRACYTKMENTEMLYCQESVATRLARIYCPENVEFWIEDAIISASDTTLILKVSCKLMDQLFGPNSKEVRTVIKEYAAELCRMYSDTEDYTNLEQLVKDIDSLVIHDETRGYFIYYILQIVGRYLAKPVLEALTVKSIEADSRIWVDVAKDMARTDPDATRKMFESYTPNYPSERAFEAWLDFERINLASPNRLLEVRKVIEELKERLNINKRSNAEESIPAKRQRQEKQEPLVVEFAPDRTRSVFVNNLDFKVTKEQLCYLFKEKAGPISQVHIGKKANGQSKGYATIEFTEPSSVEKALAIDRTRINGRPVFISEYKLVGGKNWMPTLQHSENRDPKTLYISHLSAATEEAHLQQLFGPLDGFVQVRLGLRKDGKCKGFAYVEFDHEEHAKTALSLDGTILNGQAINVLISDPTRAPKKQAQKISMVPSSMRRPKTRLGTQSSHSETTEPSEKTNDDFRKMLGLN